MQTFYLHAVVNLLNDVVVARDCHGGRTQSLAERSLASTKINFESSLTGIAGSDHTTSRLRLLHRTIHLLT